MQSDLISRLSDLRSQYNLFDENERDAYHTLTEAIAVLNGVNESAQPDLQPTCNNLATDTISRQTAILQLSHNKCGNDENDIAVQHDIETIRTLPSVQPDYGKIIAEIKQCISETREHGKHHAKFVQDNGELYISGLEMALSIIEKNR